MTARIKPRLLAADLARILDDAALFASRDSTVPMINAIKLESTPTQLVAVATDRFSLAASAARYIEGRGRRYEAVLRLPQAQLLAKIAKACRPRDAHVCVSSVGEKVSFEFTTGESLTIPKYVAVPGFPAWRSLFSASSDDDATNIIGVDPKLLARFSRVSRPTRSPMVVKVAGRNKPLRVSIGADFIGLVMPVRLDGTVEWQAPEWLADPAPSARSPKPKTPAVEGVAS